jgi:hypothetical protein
MATGEGAKDLNTQPDREITKKIFLEMQGP